MGFLLPSQDKGPSPADLQQQEQAKKIAETRSARDLARIRDQRMGIGSLLNPGLQIPGRGPGSGGSSL